jgi:hypothetical protein
MSPKLAVAFTWPFLWLRFLHISYKKKKTLFQFFLYIRDWGSGLCSVLGNDAGREKVKHPPPLPWNGKQNPEKNSNFFLFVKFKFDYKSNLKMDYL